MSGPLKRRGRELLEKLIEDRRRSEEPLRDFGAFERDLHERVAEFEREVLAEELKRLDVDVPVVLLEGVPHRRVLRSEETYLSAAGPVRVERSLYAARRDG